MRTYRIIFAGTPDFAASALNSLIESRHEILAVYTQPDRPAGRGQKLLFSPVKDLALQHNLPVEQVENFKSQESLDQLQAYQADIMVVAAYGIILPQAVLDTPKLCCLNIHASLLPRWRGAAPIQRAIMAGDQDSGISIMKMEAGLDTGDILLKKSIAIEADDTGSSLHDKLSELGGQALLESLDNFELLFAQRCPQLDAEANYAHKLNKQDGKINWEENGKKIEQHIRAFNAWPVCHSNLEGKQIRIWQAGFREQKHAHKPGEIIALENGLIEVACGNGVIEISQLQLPGKKSLSSAEVLNAKKEMFAAGKCFE